MHSALDNKQHSIKKGWIIVFLAVQDFARCLKKIACCCSLSPFNSMHSNFFFQVSLPGDFYVSHKISYGH